MEILAESAQAVMLFLREEGYREEVLSRLGLSKLPWNDRARRLASAWVVTGDARLDLLIRLFYLGESMTASQSEKVIPKEILQGLFTSELLERDAEWVRPACVLTHFGGLHLACDSWCRVEASPGDLVLGVNPTTQLLARCNMLHSGGKALDRGTLALAAASIAVYVVGTDINQRALNFSRINAALNGVGNVLFLQGDRFEPVAGRRFDSIICNPPFFLAPVSGLLYCDNGLELDRFVESLARSAPQFLEEGGVFQMLCEWVELESETWEQRLRSWFEQSGCDVHIWRGYEFSPAEYARKRAVEQAQLDSEAAAGSFGERISYLAERRVKGIFGGLISMRRRSGQNWFWVEEMQKRPAEPVGDALRERFSTRDVLESNSEQTLLRSRPRLAARVRLLSEATQRNGLWTIERSYLERADDLPAKLGLDGVVAQLAARFDGTETLETLLKQLASELKAPLDRVIPEGLRVIERLGACGLILL
jgi:hypothetical protein